MFVLSTDSNCFIKMCDISSGIFSIMEFLGCKKRTTNLNPSSSGRMSIFWIGKMSIFSDGLQCKLHFRGMLTIVGGSQFMSDVRRILKRSQFKLYPLTSHSDGSYYVLFSHRLLVEMEYTYTHKFEDVNLYPKT